MVSVHPDPLLAVLSLWRPSVLLPLAPLVPGLSRSSAGSSPSRSANAAEPAHFIVFWGLARLCEGQASPLQLPLLLAATSGVAHGALLAALTAAAVGASVSRAGASSGSTAWLFLRCCACSSTRCTWPPG